MSLESCEVNHEPLALLKSHAIRPLKGLESTSHRRDLDSFVYSYRSMKVYDVINYRSIKWCMM